MSTMCKSFVLGAAEDPKVTEITVLRNILPAEISYAEMITLIRVSLSLDYHIFN